MNNAKHYICLLCIFSAFALSTFSEAAAHKQDKPNIVFLMTDDQRWDNFGCYGRPEFRTENIDRLADEGVIFDQAYYAVAICLPSRVNTFEALPSIVFNEAAAVTSLNFQVELYNYGSSSIELDGFVIGSSDPLHPEYAIPDETLAAGEFLVLDAATLGFTPRRAIMAG